MGSDVPVEKSTKFSKKEDLISAAAFAKMIGSTFNGVKKLIESHKMTEGVSFLREKNSYLIDPVLAKGELRLTVKVSQTKNEKLLEFLELDKDVPNPHLEDDVSKMDINKIRVEQARSELRLSHMEEKVMEGKWIDRKLVEKNLEAAGIEIKNALKGIASRVTPMMLAETDPRIAENILDKAIEDALMSVVKLAETDIGA